MLKYILITLTILSAFPASSFAGNCNVASDHASDGSRCGGRAASERDGGN